MTEEKSCCSPPMSQWVSSPKRAPTARPITAPDRARSRPLRTGSTQCGDEAAAALSKKFARIVVDESEDYGSEMVEVRGDGALLVFASARPAIRAGVDLQTRFREAADELEIPLRVGIGIDSGEAVKLEDGSFRGSALNIASRLCGRASGGEVIISEATSRLAGRLTGLHYSDGGRLRLKNIAEPVHVYKVYSELDAPPPKRWVGLLGTDGRALSLRLALLVTLIAAATAVAVVTSPPAPAPTARMPHRSRPGGRRKCRSVGRSSCDQTGLRPAGRSESVGGRDGRVRSDRTYARPLGDLRLQGRRRPRGRVRDRVPQARERPAEQWQVRRPSLGRRAGLGARAGQAGGRYFCYFDGNDAVIVWTHERLNQPSHLDVMVTAREGGSDHPGLTRWWRPWHHEIGKAS